MRDAPIARLLENYFFHARFGSSHKRPKSLFLISTNDDVCQFLASGNDVLQLPYPCRDLTWSNVQVVADKFSCALYVIFMKCVDKRQ